MVFKLTRAQLAAKSEIERLCAVDYRQEPKVIAVQGLSGVGKSTLVDYIKSDLESQGHLVLRTEEFSISDDGIKNLNHGGQLICPVGVFEISEIERILDSIKFPWEYGVDFALKSFGQITRRDIALVDVRGMNDQEMKAYLVGKDSKSLSVEEIVACSFGIPALADQLLMTPHLDLEQAKRLAAVRLWNNIGRHRQRMELLDRFGVNLNPEQRRLFENGEVVLERESDHIYDRLPELRRKNVYFRLAEDFAFLAKESVSIYNKSLGKSRVGITITLPRLSSEEYDAVAKVMGFSCEDYIFKTHSRRWSIYVVNRKDMVVYGKKGTHELHTCNDGPVKDFYLPGWRGRILARKMAVDQGLINFPERRDDGSIIVKVGDHGGVNKQPINLGWMLESFLQHKGISYIVENGMIGRTYVFDPRNNSINYVDQSVMDKVEEIENGFNRWDLKN